MDYKHLKGVRGSYVLFVRADDIDCVWVDKTGDNFVTWENLVKALPVKPKAPRTGGRTKANKGSFDMWTAKGFFAEKEVDEDYKSQQWYNMRGIITHLPGGGKDITVVVVGANRLNKFKRDYPGIPEFIPYALSKIVKDGKSLLSAESKEIMSVDWSDKQWLEHFKIDKIDDPEIKRLARLAKGSPDQSEYDRNISLAQYLKKWYDVKKFEPTREKQVLKSYPLLGALNSYRVNDDIYVYMNAKYASRKDKK